MLLVIATLLLPLASAGPQICMALECNPVYRVQKLVEETVGDPDDLLQTCQAEQCNPMYWPRFVLETVGQIHDAVGLP